MKTRITSRLSLRAKFKDASTIEVVVIDDKNNIQVEIIPIRLGPSTTKVAESVPMNSEAEVTETGGQDNDK